MRAVPGGLRLVMVTHYWDPHVGGIETVARQQAEGFARRGASVEVHTTRLPRSAPAVSRWSPASGDGSVRIVRHAAADPFATMLQLPVPLPGPTMARALFAAARSADAVVVHGHSYPTSALGVAAARLARRPLVLVQHSPWIDYGPLLDRLERAVDRTVGRMVVGSAERIVAVSEHTADYVRSVRPGAAPTVVHNGVDTARFRPVPGAVPGSGADADRPRVLFVGRLVRRNGWDVLLEAWGRPGLSDRADLRIVGSGPDLVAVRARASTLRGVQVLGRVADAALADEYRTAAVVAVPSTTGEGFGLTAAEALACGTPVVASADGGLRELVRDGVDGLLVAPREPDALASALRRVVDDAALRTRLAAGARARDLGSDHAVDAVLEVILAGLEAHDGRRTVAAAVTAGGLQ
jgi:D-inositol-3-phosphate glycosyltransferase